MAGGNNLQFKLGFTADTSQADSALKRLNESIKEITDRSKMDLGLDAEFDRAAEAAEVLQKALQKAYNTNTGKLDMSAFTASIQQSGQSLDQLYDKLLNAGQMGTATFRNLALAIAQTEAPIKKMSAGLQTALTTLTNTIKWEISSGIVHGLESAFSGAVSYVKNLNSSLNDIRIVTGQSAEDMTKFAQSANKAAKELSTTTKAYADAALIYYQQGDNDEMAAKKAAITIKAANASFGSTASEMSEYLTAVWNSFQVGADQLEHYVDIMANLGANTATSLEEIATSMQKVAATANTVGVSMEQVSSIIATVSSVTRESAESIGTSYKTIFARIGDLKLGKTDEDGVGLGTVSKQLQSIGVEVLDANGELREMGDIITDLGTKWQTMNGATKTAVAQAVAGKRQYTQLMALFENWPKYQENLNLAENSDGSLQRMQDIYAESWEAASQRMQASLEGVYSQLINDKALIKITNDMANLVQGVEGFIKSIGGLPGVLATIATLMTTAFSGQITANFDRIGKWFKNFKQSFQDIEGIGGKVKSFFSETIAQRNYKSIVGTTAARMGDIANPSDSTAMKQQNDLAQTLIDKKIKIIELSGQMSAAEQAMAQEGLSSASQQLRDIEARTQAYEKETLAIQTLKAGLTGSDSLMAAYQTMHQGQAAQNPETASEDMQKKVSQWYWQSKNGGTNILAGVGINNFSENYKQLNEIVNPTNVQNSANSVQTLIDNYTKLIVVEESAAAAAQTFDATMNKQGINTQTSKEEIQTYEEALQRLKQQLQDNGMNVSWAEKLMQQFQTAVSTGDPEKIKTAIEQIKQAMEQMASTSSTAVGQSEKDLTNTFGMSSQALGEYSERVRTHVRESNGLAASAQKLKKDLDKPLEGFSNGSKTLTNITRGISSLSMSLTTANSAIANWDTSSLGSKISSLASVATSLLTQIGNPIGMAMSAIGLGIGAILGAIEKDKKRLQKEAEEINKEVDKQLEKVKELEDQSTNITTLSNDYNELYARFKAGEDVQDQLAASAQKLAEAYGITGAAVAQVTGNYDAFNETVKQSLVFANLLKDTDVQRQTLESQWTDIQGNNQWGASDTQHQLNLQEQRVIKAASNSGEYILKGTTEDVTNLVNEVLDYYSGYWNLDQDTYRKTGLFSYETIHGTAVTVDSQLYKDLITVFSQATLGQGGDSQSVTSWLQNIISSSPNITEQALVDAFAQIIDQSGLFGSVDLDNEQISSILSNEDYDWLNGIFKYYLNGFSETIRPADVIEYKQRQKSLYSEPSELDNWFDDQNKLNISPQTLTLDEFVQTYNTLQNSVLQQLNTAQTKILSEANAQSYDELTDDNKAQYDILSARIKTVNAFLQNEDIKDFIDLVTRNNQLAASAKVANQTMQQFFGSTTADTFFSDFADGMAAISETIKQDDSGYQDQLAQYEKDSDEYNAAVARIAAGIVSNATALDDYALMYTALAETFDGQQLQDAITFISQSKITDPSQLSSALLQAMKIALNNEEELDGNELIKGILQAQESSKQGTESQARLASLNTLKKELKETYTFDESTEFYQKYMDLELDKVLNWNDFIEATYEQRKAMMEDAIKEAQKTSEEQAQESKEIADGNLNEFQKNHSELFNSDGNVKSNVIDRLAPLQQFQNYVAGLEKDENGKYIEGQSADTKKIAWDLNNRGMDDTYNAYTQNTGGDYNELIKLAEAYKLLIGLQDEAANADNLVNVLKLMGTTAESTTTKINRMINALDGLPTDAEEFSQLAKDLGVEEKDLVQQGSQLVADKMAEKYATKPTLLKETNDEVLNRFYDEDSIKFPYYWHIQRTEGEEALTAALDANNERQDLFDPQEYVTELDNYYKAQERLFNFNTKSAFTTLDEDTEKIQALQDAMQEFSEGNGLTTKTQDALKLLGIDPSSLKDIKAFETQISSLRSDMALAYDIISEQAQQRYGINIDDIWNQEADVITSKEAFRQMLESNTELTAADIEAQLAGYDQLIQALKTYLGLYVNLTAEQVKNASNYDKNLAAREREVKLLQEEAELTKTARSTMNNSLNAGYLDSATQERLSRMNLQGGWSGADWSNLTQQERLQKIVEVNKKDYDTQRNLIEAKRVKQSSLDFLKSKTGSEDSETDTKGNQIGLTDILSFKDDTEEFTKAVKSRMAQLFSDDIRAQEIGVQFMQEVANGTRQFSWQDLFSELNKEDLAAQLDIKEITDEQREQLISVVSAYAQAEENAAKRVVDAWTTAFNTLYKLRQDLASGKTIAESIFGDENAIREAVAAYLSTNPEDKSLNGFKNWTQTASWDDDAFSSFDAEQYLKQKSKDDTFSGIHETTGKAMGTQGDWEAQVQSRLHSQFNAAGGGSNEEFDAYYQKAVAEAMAEANVHTMEELYNTKYAEALAEAAVADQRQQYNNYNTAQTIYETAKSNAQTGMDYIKNIMDQNNQITEGSMDASKKLITEDMVLAIQKATGNKDLTKEQLMEMSNADLQGLLDTSANTFDSAAKTFANAVEKYGADQKSKEETKAGIATDQANIKADVPTTDEVRRDAQQSAASAFSSMQDSFAQIESIQNTIVDKDSTVTAADVESLHNALGELVNDPDVNAAYEQFKRGALAQSYEQVEAASHNLTTAILEGNGAMLEQSEAADLMLQKWAEDYKITDANNKVLTVGAVNLMRMAKNLRTGKKNLSDYTKALNSNSKAWSVNGKQVSRTENIYQDIIDAANEAGQAIDDYVDSIQGATEEEKAVAKYGAKVQQICNDLGDGFDNMKQAMMSDGVDSKTIGTAFLEDMSNYMESAGIDAQNLITRLGESLSQSLDGFAAQTAEEIGVTEEQVNQAVQWLKDKLDGVMAGTVDMGELVGILGGDFGAVAALLMKVAEAYGLSAEIPGLEEFIAYVSKALAAASAFNNIGGGGSSGGSGARNAMPASPSSNSGGGGGGGGGKKDTKDLKELEDVLERYHEIEQILKRTNEQLDEIDKLKERTYGNKYLKNIDSEINKLKELSKEQEQYLNEAQEYQSGDRLRMISIGATFDEEGNINNYDEMVADWVDTYNRAIEAYNNGAQEDGDKVILENAEKEFERRQKWLKNYEESIDKVHEKQNELLELQNKISEAALEKITYNIEYNVDVRDKDLELLEYYSSTYEDVLDKQDADMYNRLGRATEYEQTLSTLSGLLTQLEQDHINGIINDAGYKEGLESIFDEAKTAAEGLKEVKDELKEIYENTLSLVDEELDKHITHLDNAKSALESYVTITGLLGQGPQYKQLSKYYEQINKNNLINLQLQKEKAEAYQKEMDYINSLRDEEGKLTEIQQERYNTLQEHLDETYTSMLEQIQTTFEDIQTAYENTIDGIFDDWDKSVAGNAGSLSNLADSYGYFAETQERTLSAAQQLHDISKLNRDIEKSMDDATNKAAKEQLKLLQDTINLKAKNNQLTKYDIDLMNLQYQLLLKQQALEDAAAAKEVVRLTRDSNGNYGYQYTADADKLATAQQEYEDVLQQINELSSNHLNETAQKLVDIQSEYKDAALSIAKDTTLTEEEKQRKLEELAQRYDETMAYYVQQYTDASEHLKTNQEAIAKHYGETIEALTSTAAGNTSKAIDEMVERSDDIKQAFKDAIGDENGGALGALKGFGDSIGNVAGLLKDMDVGTAKEKITALIGAMGDSMASFDKDNAQVMADATKALGVIADSLKDVDDATSAWEEHNSIIDATQKSYENLAINANKALHELAGIKSANIFKQQEDLAAGLIDTITDPAQMTQKFAEAIEKAQSTIDDATIKALSTSYEASLQAMTQAFSNQFKDAAFLKDATLNIEQNIHMEVSFPNATNQEEITEAINNLANRAAQYVNQGLSGKSEG